MNESITVSAPGKIHLLGEHAVVYGKPALLAAIDLRITVTLNPCHSGEDPERTGGERSRTSRRERLQNLDSGRPRRGGVARMTKVIEPIVKNNLKIKTIPPYNLEISSQIPVGYGLGSSAAISAAYIAALLTFLRVKWDLNLINNLAYEAEEIFHGNPSGGDNSTVVYGGFIWFRKETADLKLIHPLNIIFPRSRNFVLIRTGAPKESTKEMVEIVKSKVKSQKSKFKKIFDDQEQLVKDLATALKDNNEDQLIQIIKAGEKNLESMGVVSPFVKSIIRKIEKTKGCAKICGGGGKTKATGALLCYHRNISVIEQIAKSYQLPYLKTSLGAEGLRMETLF